MTAVPLSMVRDLLNDASPDSSDSEGSEDTKPKGLAPTLTDVGRRVLYYSTADKRMKYGTLRFLGETEFESGTWCGVELNNASGKNNGTFKGIRYFTCEANHGVFVPVSKVELDFGRRSRPNSTPSSRNTSVERDPPPTKSSTQSTKGINTLTLQQQIVNRLSAPVHKRSKTGQSVPNNRRQPLKAFATRGVQREELKEKKLPPFKAGGMVKARSTENISKENSTGSLPKISGKKSTSERDLRGIGKKEPQATKKDGKGLKKGRVNSCSDLSTGHTPSRKVPHPKTSTPIGPRDPAPDGCSSPDDDSGSNTSQNDNQNLPVSSTPPVVDTAFVKTPELEQEAATPVSGPKQKPNLDGIQYAHVQLINEELSRPSYNRKTVPDPEAPGKIYKNRTSGSATLPHPLVAAQHEAGEATVDGLDYTTLLEPNAKLEGVTVQHVLAALGQLHKQLMQERATSRASNQLVETLRQENYLAIEKLEEKHKKEVQSLRRIHEFKLKQLMNNHNK